MAMVETAVARQEFDVVVVGSGAGGLAAAVTAAELGLSVLVLEKHRQFGGTTAWSGGWMWVPRNPLAVRAGIVEDIEGPRRYLRNELGEYYDEPRVEAFLRHAPAMVSFFEQKTALQFIAGNTIPDFHGKQAGAVTGGRSVCAAPFDGRALGRRLADMREPLELIAPWRMGIASGADLGHFMNAMRSARSFAHVTRRVLRHFWERATQGRGMHLVNGNALVAGLAKSAFDRRVDIRVAAPVVGLLRADDGRVAGVRVRDADGRETEIGARRGVVLACGGFPHDVERKQALFAHAPTGREHWSAAPPSNTGDGLRLGESVGAGVDAGLYRPAGWAPVSLVPGAQGESNNYPHLIERAKPGVMAVTQAGQRFVNEADSYYDFMEGLFQHFKPGQPAHAWLVCDHRFLRRYGLGAVRPAPMPYRWALRSGYLKQGRTLADLAQRCGIEAGALEASAARYNEDARQGVDTAFGRGDTPYNRVQGDAECKPNPCMAPIEQGPFYAVRLVPGSLGTFAGLRTNEHAQVLDQAGNPIAGLYACGADMSSVMGGRYPSGGITLGPAMTFGYIAGHHMAGKQPAAV
ncbi:FAD-dependent oxidoreductase [Kerstersia gyiorum]|uniref:FAD-dependent oxidoreductase n=1 Tax=Kerstersia gyiorum TaxID=206506 RepID=UPI003B432867